MCKICAGLHTTEDCPSLPGLKAVYQNDNGANKAQERLCYVAPRGLWQPHQPNMMQYPYAQFQGYAQKSQGNWKTPLPWQPWESQFQPQNQP